MKHIIIIAMSGTLPGRVPVSFNISGKLVLLFSFLISVLISPDTVYSQITSSSSTSPSLGISIGSASMEVRAPANQRKHIMFSLNGYYPLGDKIGMFGEFSYGAWPAVNPDTLPLEWPEWPEELHDLTGIGGKYLELHFGPMLTVGNIWKTHFFSAALLGVRKYEEKWESYHPYREWPGPVFLTGPTETQFTAEVRLRMAFNRQATGMMLEAGYVWSSLLASDSDTPAYTSPDGLRLLIHMPLYPWPYLIERIKPAEFKTPETVYHRGVAGTFLGIVGGIVAIESFYVLHGEKLGKAADYSYAIIAGGIAGSALAISRARKDFRLAPVAARLTGGAFVAVVESILFNHLFDFNLPNPGLMLTVPLGSMLGEHLLGKN